MNTLQLYARRVTEISGHVINDASNAHAPDMWSMALESEQSCATAPHFRQQ